MTFAEELDLARRDGVNRGENLPFLLTPSEHPKAGVVLVHGFTASPWEMRLLGEALVSAGYAVLGVRLPGHGTTVNDLERRSYEEWLATVERGYLLLAGKGLRCYGVGLSTGALLLLALAARRQLKGLVLLSPYLKLRNRLAPASVLLRHIWHFQHHEVAAELVDFYYDRRPVSGIYQLCRLSRQVRRILRSVTAPALVISGAGDQTVEPESAFSLFIRLTSPQKEFHCFGPNVPHILTTSENPLRAETFHIIVAFLQRLDCFEDEIRAFDKAP